jgi:SH3-like domain-containing protein
VIFLWDALSGAFCIHTFVRLKNFKIDQINKRKMFTRSAARHIVAVAAFAMALGLSGCSRFRPKPKEDYVYVTAKQTYLRDRVAAVSNRTGTATNGEKLVVLDHARRFLKVRTPDGSVGWIEEKLTAGQAVADHFEALGAEHEKNPVVASATARDEVYLHIAPGKETERFYRLAEGDTLSLLERAAVEKPVTPGAAVVVVANPAKTGDVTAAPAGPVYEDWWLVRDAKGRTGWIYSHMIDVSAPDALARYAEGQRYVGAYVLGYADDPASGMLNNGSVVTRIPEYVTVLSPYKAGLPYDFNQVRVFTWNTKKHRYETAMRDHNIAGYLPVVIADKADPYGKSANASDKLPSFTYRVLAGDQAIPVPNAATGLIKPGRTVAKTYRLEGNLCRRLIAPGTQAPAEAHPDPEPEKKAKKKK